jgi:hypothetical protein
MKDPKMDITTLNKIVWEEMVYANMRASYFGDLVRVYQQRDKYVRIGVLVLTSGSVATAMLGLDQNLKWALPILATIGSLWLLLSQYSTLSRDASDLCLEWGKIASEYERLWNHLGDPDSEATYHRIYSSADRLTKQGAKFPKSGKRIEHWFDHSVEMLLSRYKTA